jgi:hypothetical protein
MPEEEVVLVVVLVVGEVEQRGKAFATHPEAMMYSQQMQ